MYRVLLADDEQIERMALARRLMRRFGDILQISEATNGKEAVQLYEKEHSQIIIMDISMPEFMLKTEDGTEVKASDLTADGKHILMFLEEEKEPTEHILNEMMEQEEAFAGYAEQIIFVVRSKEALETPTLSKALAKLKNIQIYYDDFSEIINTLGRRMYVDPDKLPLIIVTNGSLNGIYATSGYNVGTGDMLLRLM
jgi:CheY-like chemotaxis protein